MIRMFLNLLATFGGIFVFALSVIMVIISSFVLTLINLKMRKFIWMNTQTKMNEEINDFNLYLKSTWKLND